MTWKDVVRDALLKLNGQGHLSEINEKVKSHPKTKTNPKWEHTIRGVVSQYEIFKPLGKGVYRLMEEVPIKAEQQSFTEEPEIDHGIAQEMLVALWKIYGYETYVPPHDQTIRSFQRKPLRDLVSVLDCTSIFKGPNLSFEGFTVKPVLLAIELIAIQEKTNYPKSSLTQSLYKDFRVKDRFSVIQKAVLKRLR